MRGDKYLVVERIGGFIFSIESHWNFLQGVTPGWPLTPGFIFADGAMQVLGEDVRADNLLRQRLLDDPTHQCPAIRIIDTLWAVANEGYKDESVREHLRIGSAWSAYTTAKKSMTNALTKAELNELGWMLTQLVALDSEPIKKVLLSLHAKGGLKSGESRRAGNSVRDSAICHAGQRLKSEGRTERDLVGIIAETETGAGLSGKRIREILRNGGVIPAAPRKGT